MSVNEELTEYCSDTFQCEKKDLFQSLTQSLQNVKEKREQITKKNQANSNIIIYVMGLQYLSEELAFATWELIFPNLCVILVNKDTSTRFYRDHLKVDSSLLVKDLQREHVNEFYLTTVSDASELCHCP